MISRTVFSALRVLTFTAVLIGCGRSGHQVAVTPAPTKLTTSQFEAVFIKVQKDMSPKNVLEILGPPSSINKAKGVAGRELWTYQPIDAPKEIEYLVKFDKYKVAWIHRQKW